LIFYLHILPHISASNNVELCNYMYLYAKQYTSTGLPRFTLANS